MANDRVNLRCLVCGSERGFIKYYPTVHAGGSGMLRVLPCEDEEADGFLEWVEKHLHCTEVMNGSTSDLQGSPGFEFFTESGNHAQQDRS